MTRFVNELQSRGASNEFYTRRRREASTSVECFLRSRILPLLKRQKEGPFEPLDEDGEFYAV